MATAVKARRRSRRRELKPGKEAWQIVGPAGAILRELGYGEGPALIGAHEIAMRDFDKPVTLTVRLKPLFGEPDIYYRVVRNEDGSIDTRRI